MSARGTSLLYKTNLMSDSGVDALATREMDQLDVEDQAVCRICGEDVNMITAEKAATVCRCSRRKICATAASSPLAGNDRRHSCAAITGTTM